jgi:hypothetical protein
LQIVASLALFAIVAFGVGYFMRAYRILRVLEMVDVLCDVRLEEHERARELNSASSAKTVGNDAPPLLHKVLTGLFRTR